MSRRALSLIALAACLLSLWQPTSPAWGEAERVQSGLLSYTTVGFKPEADPAMARSEFHSIGIDLPGNKLCSYQTILATPDRHQTMQFVEALRQSDIVFDVDYTYSDQYQKQFNERMLADTAYLRVRFKKAMPVASERAWLEQNFPQLKDVALQQIDQPYVFSKSIATSKDGTERETQGALDNPWYIASNFTFKTMDVTESTVPIAKIRSFQSVLSVQTHAQPIFTAPLGPPTYTDILASRIRRAWYPPLRSTNQEPITVRLLI